MHTNIPTIRTAHFDGTYFEDSHEMACRVADHPDGVAWIVSTRAGDTGYGLFWASDDSGRVHYAVTDGTAWPVYAATVDEAWEQAVTWALGRPYPATVEVSYDPRIPAIAYGDRADLYARIPTN